MQIYFRFYSFFVTISHLDLPQSSTVLTHDNVSLQYIQHPSWCAFFPSLIDSTEHSIFPVQGLDGSHVNEFVVEPMKPNNNTRNMFTILPW